MRQKTFRVSDTRGMYIQVYQRPGERPMVDLNLFDGREDDPEMLLLMSQAILAARELSLEWSATPL